MKRLILILTSVLFMALSSVALAPIAGIPAGWLFGGLTAASFVPMQQGVAMMAIQKEIWINDIVSNLFKANPFMNFAMNADEFVLAGKVVHIPNAGSAPTVKRNRTNLPATVLIREDVDITFSLDEFTSDPILIPKADEYELSYDKKESIMGEKKAALSELVGDWMLRNWAPTATGFIYRTSGDSITAHVGTGNRKAVGIADIKAMQKLMNKNNVPRDGRYAQLDADMYDQLTTAMTATQYRDFSSKLNVEKGVVGELFGFTFVESRSDVLKYTNDTVPVPKDPDATAATTDNAGGLFWQKDMVIRALGTHEFFENENDATYYGSIYSAMIRAGGRKKRNDGKGVFALVQTAV